MTATSFLGRLRACVPAVPAALVLQVAPVPARPAPEEPDPAPAVAILEHVERWADVAGGGERLAALGPAYLRAFLDFLAAPDGGALGAAVPALESRRRAVRIALQAQPATAVRGELDRLTRSAPNATYRVEGMQLLSRVGDVDDVLLLGRLAAGGASLDAPIAGPQVRAFEEALERLLARDPGGVSRLPLLILDAHPALRAAFVGAADELPRPVGVPVLTAMLGRDPRVDVLVLSALAASRPGPAVSFEKADLAPVRALLGGRDCDRAALAATAAAALDDQSAVELLVSRVRADHDGLSRAAAEALQRLTGRRFGPDAELWARWLESERRWWSASADAARATLRHGSSADAARVLGEMAGLRLHRDRLAEILALALDRPEPDLVRVACRALGGLGSRTALPGLVEVLRTGPGDSRAAAHEALVRLTRRSLPATAEAWEVVLQVATPR